MELLELMDVGPPQFGDVAIESDVFSVSAALDCVFVQEDADEG